MAKFEKLIPHIIKWETSTIQQAGESVEHLFERARKKGVSIVAGDAGGATIVGVTLATYKSYCRKHGISTPTVENLKNIPYKTWLDILKGMFWDKWKADEIESQPVANMLVDWVWHSGTPGIKRPQEILGVVPDGIVGRKTLAAVNSKGPVTLFHTLKSARIAFLENIVKVKPSQKKFLAGWKNRVNDLKYV